jgi:hypothetical protein
MPIINVIDILLKGSGSHFEKTLVDDFLSIPTNKIVKVFLSENNGKINSDDENVLSKYNLLDIYNYGTNETPTDEQKKVFDLFNKYYTGLSEENIK